MASFGETLKRERELREISLREIADATKINIRFLEALEQNRFEILPGGVFNKGFIRAFAKFVGADGESLVDAYLQEIASREPSEGTVAAAGRSQAPGLHRPTEAPRRRSPAAATAASAQPAEAVPPPAQVIAFAEPAAPDLTLKKLAAAVEQRRAAEAREAGEGRARALMIGGSIVVGAALVIGVMFAARSMTSRHAAVRQAADSGTGLLPPESARESVVPATTTETAPATSPEEGGEAHPANPPAVDQTIAAADGETRHEPQEKPAAESETHQAQGTERPRLSMVIPPSPAPPPSHVADPSPPAAAPSGPMDLRLEATAPVLVQVSCDGEDRINRPLLAGETASVRCFSVIRISATDAGVLRLAVNGARCASLGEAGSRVQGFAIRSDDFQSICPPSGESADARR